MKKLTFIIVCLCLVIATLLCGCGSFAWSDDGEVNSIKKIEKIVDSEGNVFIEVHYTNTKDVDKFLLPEGNGIADIDYKANDEDRVTVVTITYTSGDSVVLNIPYGKDGENGSSMNMVKLSTDLNGTPWLIFYEESPDGTLTEQGKIDISQLKGKDGLGIEKWEHTDKNDPIGEGVKITLTGETEPRTYYFNYYKDISLNLEGNEYVITIGDKNPNSTPAIFRLTRMPTWLQGNDFPHKEDGIAGDFYFDTYHDIIYTKIGEDESDPSIGYWHPVAELSTKKNAKFTITFKAGNGTIAGYDEYKTSVAGEKNVYELGNIPYNSYFYDAYGAIPVPTQPGFKFLGWYRSATPAVGEAAFNDFVLVTNDITLIARWEKIEG